MDPSLQPIYQCRYCGDCFTARGLYAHEQWCDENPNPGVPPNHQQDRDEAAAQ